MKGEKVEAFKWQFQLTWQLMEYHLPALSDEMCLWEPSKNSWNVRLAADGKWRPDFSDTEPHPIPTVTIGWVTWQILWWWQAAIRAVENQPAVQPQDVQWPGSAQLVREQFSQLKAHWEHFLENLSDSDLEKKVTHLWPGPTPLWQSVVWVNSELMKNTAELGYIRFLYESK